MPKVPVYDSPQVRSQGIPDASIHAGGVNPGAFGAIQGEQLQQAGKIADVAVHEMMKAQEEKDVADGMEAANKLQEQAQAYRQELEKRAGKDADGVQNELKSWYENKQKEIGGTLKSDRAAMLFNRNADKLRLRDDDWAAGYQKQQMGVYYDVQMKTGIENAKNSALYNPTPEGVTASLNDIRAYLNDTKNRKGYDQAWVDSNLRDAEQGIHGSILQNAIDQDAVGSVQSYIQQFGDKLDPGLKGKAEKLVHNKVIDETAGAYADSLIAGGVSYSEALAGAREKFSGEDEDKYIRRIKERYGEAREMENLYVKETNDRFEKLAYEKGVDKLSDDDLDALAEKDAGAAARWKNLRDNALEIKAAGGDTPKYSNQEYLAEANKRLNSDGPDRITNPQQLSQYKHVLSASDFNTLEKGLDENRKVKESDLLEAYKIFAPEGKQKPSKWKQDDWADYFAFKQMAQDAVRETANPDYIGKLSAEWWLKGKVKGTGIEIPYFGEVGAKTITKGSAYQSGKSDAFTTDAEIPRNAITEPGLNEDDRQRQIQEATQWIEQNPNDPRVPAIKRKLGM